MTTFRNAIAICAIDASAANPGDAGAVADAILAMPEMQAIREAMRPGCRFAAAQDRLMELTADEPGLIGRTPTNMDALPASVRAWVLP